MTLNHCFFLSLLTLIFPGSTLAFPPLQLFIELTPPGKVFHPPPGIYSGPVIIKRPITIDGGRQVTIDGEGNGTVLTVRADNVTLRGLHIKGSGNSHDQLDAGISLHADKAIIEHNNLEDVLFGIQLQQANSNTIRSNHVTSKPHVASLRGEGVRLWYSHDNVIENNQFHKVRDLVFTNSENNRIVRNTIDDSRIGMEFIFSPDNEIKDNVITNNGTGIVAIYSDALRILGNRIQHLRGISGSAIALKDSSAILLKGNDVIHCATGLTANAPVHPENIVYIYDNRFAFNDVALYFYGEKGGHVIHRNRFEQNLTDVRVTTPSGALGNDWQDNYWDTYAGVDLDRDGIGDAPHELYIYADRIWMERPMTRFFRGSPTLETIDFIERLLPFSNPDLILRDSTPRMP